MAGGGKQSNAGTRRRDRPAAALASYGGPGPVGGGPEARFGSRAFRLFAGAVAGKFRNPSGPARGGSAAASGNRRSAGRENPLQPVRSYGRASLHPATSP